MGYSVGRLLGAGAMGAGLGLISPYNDWHEIVAIALFILGLNIWYDAHD